MVTVFVPVKGALQVSIILIKSGLLVTIKMEGTKFVRGQLLPLIPLSNPFHVIYPLHQIVLRVLNMLLAFLFELS